MLTGKEFIEKYYSDVEEEERLYSIGNDELDDLLEKAFCDGYEYAQKEFNSRGQKELRRVTDYFRGSNLITKTFKPNVLKGVKHKNPKSAGTIIDTIIANGRDAAKLDFVGDNNLHNKINIKGLAKNNKEELRKLLKMAEANPSKADTPFHALVKMDKKTFY